MNFENQTNGNRDADTFAVRASIREITDAARHHAWLVVATCVMTLGMVTAYILMWPPIFRASATIMAERESDVARDAFYGGWNVFRKDDPKAEIELMKAGPILKKVIEAENLTYDDVYHPFLSHVAYLWGKSWVGQKYRAVKAKFLPPEDGALSQEEIDLARTIVDMRAGVMIEPVGTANVGTVTVSGPSRQVASVANTLLDVYMAERSGRHLEEAQRSYDVLDEEVKAAAKELEIAEQNRLKFVQEHAIAFDFQKEGLEVAKLTELEQLIAGSRSKIASLAASLAEVEQQIRNEPQVRTTSTVFEHNSIREAAKMKRLELQTALIHARGRYRDDSPEVQELQRDLAELDAVIAEASERVEKATTEGLNQVQQELVSRKNGIQTEFEGAQAGLVVLEETADRMRKRMAEVPSLQITMRSLEREFEWARDKHIALLGKRAQADISLATSRATTPTLQIIEYAVPPSDRAWPKAKYLYPAGLLIGLILGVCAALLLSYADGKIRREHVEGGRRAAPLYGTIGVPVRAQPFAVLPTGKATAIPSQPASER